MEVRLRLREHALERRSLLGRHEPYGTRIVLRQVLDDDGRLGDDPIPLAVMKDGKLREGPDFLELLARGGIAEVDEAWLEGRFVLVQSDQHLPAVGRQRMK